MPVVTVTLIEGYDEATRRRLAEALTDAVRATIAAPLDGVTVVLDEVAPGNYLRGRTPRRPGPPLPDPAQTVRDFLAALEARDLVRAGAEVPAIITVIDRLEGARENVEAAGLAFEALFTKRDLGVDE